MTGRNGTPMKAFRRHPEAPRSCLVTGGAGFIGSHLVESLLASGHRVVVIDDLSTGSWENLAGVADHPHANVVIGSITNDSLMEELIGQADEVYHLAAVVGVRRVLERPEWTMTVNTEATAKILRMAAQRSIPIFLASSSEVYGKNPKVPLGEDDDSLLGSTCKGRWIYAFGKAMDEFLALALHRDQGLPVVVGRFFNTVGPRQVGRYGMVLPRFVDQALRGQPLEVHGDGRQIRCFGHVLDVVSAVRRLMESPGTAGRVYNIGNAQPVSIRRLARCVADQIDPRLPIRLVPYEEVFGPEFEDIRCRVPDLSRIRSAIGYQPRHGLREIIRDIIAWKRATGKPAGVLPVAGAPFDPGLLPERDLVTSGVSGT